MKGLSDITFTSCFETTSRAFASSEERRFQVHCIPAKVKYNNDDTHHQAIPGCNYRKIAHAHRTLAF